MVDSLQMQQQIYIDRHFDLRVVSVRCITDGPNKLELPKQKKMEGPTIGIVVSYGQPVEFKM